MLVSDHDLIIGHLQYTSHFKWGKNRWRNNCGLYKEPGFLEEMRDFWIRESFSVDKNTNIIKWWVNVKYQFKRYAIKKGKELSQVKRRSFQMEQCGLDNLYSAILQNPNNATLHKKYNELKKKLANQKIHDIKEKIFKEKANAILFGVQPTKTFFHEIQGKN